MSELNPGGYIEALTDLRLRICAIIQRDGSEGVSEQCHRDDPLTRAERRRYKAWRARYCSDPEATRKVYEECVRRGLVHDARTLAEWPN